MNSINIQLMNYKHKYDKYKNKYLSLKKNQIGNGIDKEIYLVRHGQTDWNKLGKGQGQEADIPLNRTGMEQAQKTGLYLKNYRIGSNPFDCIVASPMVRTMESAEIIKNIIDFKGEIEYDDILKERKHGKLSGLTDEDELMQKVKAFKKTLPEIKDPIEKYNSFNSVTNTINEKFNIGMESDEQLANRIKPFIQKLIDSPCKKILIIGHGGLLLCLIRELFKIIRVPEGDLSNGDNCWISYITYNNDTGFKLVSPIDTQHLALK